MKSLAKEKSPSGDKLPEIHSYGDKNLISPIVRKSENVSKHYYSPQSHKGTKENV